MKKFLLALLILMLYGIVGWMDVQTIKAEQEYLYQDWYK